MVDELSRLVDALPGLIWIAEADARIDFVSQRWCEYTGLGIADMSEGWHAVVHPQDMRMVQERWSLMVADSKVVEMELRLRRFDREYHWFLLRACPFSDASGNKLKWCGINTDIDERKRGEQALCTLQSNLRQCATPFPGSCAQ